MKTELWRNRTLFPALVSVGVILCAAPLADVLAFGGGGGGGRMERGGGGGGGGGFHGGGGGSGRAGGAAQNGGGPRGGGQINNVHADQRTNNVRNTSVNNVNNNNVNINRNVNVNNNGNYHGGGWDNDYHPVATAAAVTATVAVTSAVIGSMVRTVPANCVPVNYGGMIYQQCGTTWYQPQGTQYVVVRAPY
jgi:hypothetical protein